MGRKGCSCGEFTTSPGSACVEFWASLSKYWDILLIYLEAHQMLCTNLWCWLTAAVPPSRCSWRERDSERGCSSCVLAVPCSTSSSLIAGEGSASLPANSALSGNCSKGDDYQLAIFWASGWHIKPNEPLKTLHHLRNTDVLHEFQVVQPY